MSAPSVPKKAGAVTPIRPKDQFADVGTCASTRRKVRLCYNTFGSAKHPCVLLIMGLASPGPFWDDPLCTTLSLAGPFYVVRYDQRDVGCSTPFDDGEDASEKGSPAAPSSSSSSSAKSSGGATSYMRFAYAALRPGKRTIPEVYTLYDLAADAFGLLDALKVELCHLVGTSMGGMVAQCMVITNPGRVLSLTLLSSHSSSPDTRWPSMRDMVGMLSLMPKSTSAKYAGRIAKAASAEEREQLCSSRDAERVTVYAACFVKLLERLSGDTKRYPFDRQAAQRQMERVFRRSLYINGGPRQFLALLNAPSRDAALRSRITSRATTSTPAARTPLYVPTIVIQGDQDPLVPAANAKHLVAVIPGSQLYLVEGMGHTLIPALRDSYVRLIRDNVRAGETTAKSSARRTALAAAAKRPPAAPARTASTL